MERDDVAKEIEAYMLHDTSVSVHQGRRSILVEDSSILVAGGFIRDTPSLDQVTCPLLCEVSSGSVPTDSVYDTFTLYTGQLF